MLWISLLLGIIVAILLFWIYYSGGGTTKAREYKKRVEELEEENRLLKETNETLRSGMESNTESSMKIVGRVNQLVRNLVRVKDALKGSDKARDLIEEEYGIEIGPRLVREIFSREKSIHIIMKRKIANEVFLGEIGRDILRGIDEGKGTKKAFVEAGIPIRVGNERLKILKEVGYLDRKLNLTEWGSEVLEHSDI